MPVKNAMPYLVACLDSIINQTITNWELIAINDSSDDDSYTILKEYAQKDNRIQVVQCNGSGIIDALRTGYNISKGNYITRMDADDLMPKDKLKLMSEMLSNNEDCLVTGYVNYFSENGIGQGFENYQNWLNSLVDNDSHYSEIYKECVIPSPCWMTTRKTFDNCGGFNSDTYPEDYDLTFRFYKNNIKILPIKEELHLWRDHSYRTSRKVDTYSKENLLLFKLKAFLKYDYDINKQLVIWGAGKKGKTIAKSLSDADIDFEMVCNNPNKIGHELYGKIWKDNSNSFSIDTQYQLIITVSKQEDQQEIKNQLVSFKLTNSYWFS